MDGDSPILTEGRCSIGSIPKCRRESHCWRCAAMWAPSMQKVKGVSRMQPQVAEATNMEMLKPKSCWFKQQNVCFNMSNQHFKQTKLEISSTKPWESKPQTLGLKQKTWKYATKETFFEYSLHPNVKYPPYQPKE